ncbi:MAG: hypothetical protein NW200_04765 [Hyphomonadaceae bacterium]|nr:hypothetical protein [Hyphomonadaceae bacterium]
MTAALFLVTAALLALGATLSRAPPLVRGALAAGALLCAAAALGAFVQPKEIQP